MPRGNKIKMSDAPLLCPRLLNKIHHEVRFSSILKSSSGSHWEQYDRKLKIFAFSLVKVLGF